MPKKTKATKITDIRASKPWLKKKGIQSYELETKNVNASILIVCEGQTEELYFKSFPVANVDVQPVHLGTTKTPLVECALEMAKNGHYDEVWCVYDYDVKRDLNGQADDYNQSIDMAAKASTEECKIKCAYSNDCFELWFILHYLYTDEQHHRSFYYEKLSDLWKVSYERFGKTRSYALKIYNLLMADKDASQEDAIKRAEKLFHQYIGYNYHTHNPITTVYQLVEKLNQYLKK